MFNARPEKQSTRAICMHVRQPLIDETLVLRLLTTLIPQWADLPVRRVASSGWDNRTFRLGEQLIIRLPSAEEYASQVDREHRWLPALAPNRNQLDRSASLAPR